MIRLIISFIIQIIYKFIVKLKYRKVNFGDFAKTDLSTYFEGYNYVQSRSSLKKSHIGFGSYIAGDSRLYKIKIGRFCSIGQNVKNHMGIHPSKEYVSTHPSFYSVKKQAGFTFIKRVKLQEHIFVDEEKKYLVEIGNDVWIGNNVIIMDGVKIGNGAIVAAGSIVNKNVDPYSIVGGTPVKLIRYRFNDEQIKYLEKLKWWNKSINWLKENAEYFESVDILRQNLKNRND